MTNRKWLATLVAGIVAISMLPVAGFATVDLDNPALEEPIVIEDPTEPVVCEHVWSDWSNDCAATYLKEGSKHRECLECGEVETAAIPKLKAYKRWVTVEGKKYYLNSKSNPVTGWNRLRSTNSKKSKIKWCYFNSKGELLKCVSKNTKNKWVKVDGKKFYFTKKKKPISSGLPYYKYKYKTFVLVDISDQKCYFYKKKKLKATYNVVTGGQNSKTPTGTFKIKSKKRNITLVGKDYRLPVSYWISFIRSEYGFHDATWRDDSDFDSNQTYLVNGSHGCVNMRLSNIKSLYGKVKKGTRVIICK